MGTASLGKHYNNGRLPSHIRKGSFCWRDNLNLLELYKRFSFPQILSGSTSLLWHDKWNNLHQPLASTAPELFSFAINKLITIQHACNEQDLASLFQLPLSSTAFMQYQELQNNIQDLEVHIDGNGQWMYTWGNGNFAAKKIYRNLTHHEALHPAYKWLWKCFCQPKHKVFFWLLLKDRLSTRNVLRRRNMELDTYSCALCNSLAEETLEHLFLECPFAAICWNIIQVQIPLQSSLPEIFQQIKDQLDNAFFMESIILLCWVIWTERNDLIFNGI